MGLDQYLNAEAFYSPSEWRGEKSNETYKKVLETVEATEFTGLADFPSVAVSVGIGYWRKANAIHQWFVINCQDGEDDCKKWYVSREHLTELLATCEKIILDKQVTGTDDLANELLPPTSGFFFGSQDYDEWYYKDLAYTVELLTKVLATVPESWSFSYQSSW